MSIKPILVKQDLDLFSNHNTSKRITKTLISPTYMGLMTSLGLNYITFKGQRRSRAASLRVPADLGLTDLFLVNFVVSN